MGQGDQVRLNLGCGGKLLPGFINIDLPGNWSGEKPDIECDVKKLALPHNYADEVHAYHVFEHFERYEAEDILAEWTRVLKPGGKMVLELPCLDKIICLFNHYIEHQKPINPRLTTFGLYGDPGYKNAAMIHRWCYSQDELASLMVDAGMEVTVMQPQTHIVQRDMRLEGIKSAPH